MIHFLFNCFPDLVWILMQKFWSFYSSLAHTLHWTKGIQTPALVQGCKVWVQGLQNCCIISPMTLMPKFWTSQVWGVARRSLLSLLRYRRLCDRADPALSHCWYQFLFVFAVREGIKWVVGTYLCKSRNHIPACPSALPWVIRQD